MMNYKTILDFGNWTEEYKFETLDEAIKYGRSRDLNLVSRKIECDIYVLTLDEKQEWEIWS